MTNACWGGLTGKRAQKIGVPGVIIDGRVRDLQELRDIGFPVPVMSPFLRERRQSADRSFYLIGLCSRCRHSSSPTRSVRQRGKF